MIISIVFLLRVVLFAAQKFVKPRSIPNYFSEFSGIVLPVHARKYMPNPWVVSQTSSDHAGNISTTWSHFISSTAPPATPNVVPRRPRPEALPSSSAKTLWRTVKDVDLSRADLGLSKAHLCSEARFLQVNKDWRSVIMTDADISRFVKARFNNSEQRLFEKLPVGVMRADAWRYMVLREFGGFYADQDVELGAYSNVRNWETQHGRVVYHHAAERLFVGWGVVDAMQEVVPPVGPSSCLPSL